MTNVRIAGIEDIDDISRVLAASWKTVYRGIVHDDYLDALKNDHWVEFLNAGLKSGSIFSMVIEISKKIIGAAILSEAEQKGEANLISFYLLPEKIGQGFGHVFYSAIEDELRRRGFQNCVLDVLERNARAIHFYITHGYADTHKKISATLGTHNYMCKVFMKSL